MGQIQVTINNRSYAIACDDGQEGHVGRLARYLERKVATLIESVGQVGDARLLLMASLIVADELAEAERELATARSDGEATPLPRAAESDLVAALDAVTARVAAIADRLERD
jgi:cell division protein ZapA